jgi:hypothetical protein
MSDRLSMIARRLLPQRASHQRKSDVLVAAATTFPFTSNIDVDFPTEGLVMVVATGLAAPVAVDLTGELNGAGDTETITVSNSGSMLARSVQRWTKITQVRVDETQAGSCTVFAKTLGNEPLTVTSVLTASLPVRIRTARMMVPETEGQGRQFVERYVGYTRSSDQQFGDLWVVDGITYEVEHALATYGKLRRHHDEVRLRRVS